MATSCRLSPVIVKRNGIKLEEKSSKLFADIKKAVKDNDTAWNLWAYTKTDDFRDTYKDVERDDLGEVTFQSLIKVLGLEDIYNNQKSIEEVMRDYGFENTVFENQDTAIGKINLFNSKENRYVASLVKTEGGHRIKVLPRNGANLYNAWEQAFNSALSKEIVQFLQSMGFNVAFVEDPKFKGLFDPENATLRDGLIDIIKISKGEMGEEALPEEFSHLIIEGLLNHPLVQRLLDSLSEDQIRDALGDSFDKYNTEYDGNILKLKKEAAGKLLAQYITNKGTISKETIQPKKSLLSRIWSWVKNLFSKVTGRHLANIRQRADDSIAGIYELITSDDAIEIFDKGSIMRADKFYALKEEYNTIGKIAVEGETTVAKMLQHKKRTYAPKNEISETESSLARIKKAYQSNDAGESEVGDPYAAVVEFLDDTVRQVEIIRNEMIKAQKGEEEKWSGDKHKINKAAIIVREIDTLTQGYGNIVSTIASFNALTDKDLAQLGITEQDAQVLAAKALKANKILTELISWRQATNRNVLAAISRTVLPHDIKRGIGSRRDEIMSLEQILEHADRDINLLDRWFTAMSDADDAFLTLFDSIVKNQQYERDEEMREWYAEITNLDKALRDAGFSSDFMIERDANGDPTGRILSIYDWDTFNKERAKKIEELRKLRDEGKLSREKYAEELRDWKLGTDKRTGKKRLIKVYVDPKVDEEYRRTGKEPKDVTPEFMPNPEVYDKNVKVIDNLAPAQRDYYYNMMRIKREMMTKIPHRGQGIYKVIWISKDFVEGVIDNSTGNPFNATLEYYKKKFVRRPDDIGFGTSENFKQTVKEIIRDEKDTAKAAEKILNTLSEQTDEDVIEAISSKSIQGILNGFERIVNNKEMSRREAVENAATAVLDKIASENFYIVDTDFADHEIQKLPIYYTRPLRNKKMLSTDFTGSLVAYSAMAVNYEKMNEVIDILEVGRTYAKEQRQLRQNEGDVPLMSKFTALGKVYKSYVERAGNGTLIAGRLDDYMDSVVYEKRKESAGTVETPIGNIDVAKTIDTIKDYTGLISLGFNIFSTLSNLAVGKLQQWIEAVGGEYFTVKDYALAVKQYSTEIWGCMAEIGSPVKKNKLSLLIQTFDPMGEYFESFRGSNFQKNALSRILGNGVLAYVGMNAGEHVLHCQTMLAILNNTKLVFTKNTNGHNAGDKISLYDALEVKEVNGITKLVLQDNLAYERELIDYSGTTYKDASGRLHSNNPNYGKPIRDKDNKIKTELVPINNTIEARNLSREERKEANEPVRNYYKFIHKKKRIIRKVNDSLNGAFNVNDKGAIHKKAWGRLIMQFRQWMPAHYMRRFARAHYDADLEQWREGYYITVAKTINNMIRELKRAGAAAAVNFKYLSEHEKANLRRAIAEISEFAILFSLVRLGGRVKDRDRSWLDKMALYQIRRMYLEVGASMPLNGAFFDNIFQILRSPAASIDTFEKVSKILQFWNMFDEIERGRFQGWSEWERDAFNLVPALGQIYKAVAFDDSMFSQFEQDN